MRGALFAFMFLSAIYAVIHIIFICTATRQYDWKGIEGPFECIFFFAKVVHVHINLANNEVRSLVNAKSGE